MGEGHLIGCAGVEKVWRWLLARDDWLLNSRYAKIEYGLAWPDPVPFLFGRTTEVKTGEGEGEFNPMRRKLGGDLRG